VIVRFADIGGIFDHHKSLLIIKKNKQPISNIKIYLTLLDMTMAIVVSSHILKTSSMIPRMRSHKGR
jgi:hypothetical protein